MATSSPLTILILASPVPRQAPSGRLPLVGMSMYQHGVLRQQRVLLGLILVMAAAFVWQMIVEHAGYSPFMCRPAEVTASWRRLTDGGLNSSDIATFGTMLSCAILHADGGHILGNMLFLWLFAALAVELLGSFWMLTIFFFTALTGSLGHTLLNPYDYTPTLGASGAVMGFEGAYLAMAVRWRLPDPHVFPLSRPVPPTNLAIMAVAYFALDWSSVMNHSDSNVAFGAHLGGFMGGLFLTSFIVPKPKMAELR